MSNVGNHCRTGASSFIVGEVRRGFLSAQRDGRCRSFWGRCLIVLMDMFCKIMSGFFFNLAVVIEGFIITSLGHTTLVPSVIFFLVPVPAFPVGMVLSGSHFAACLGQI